MSKQWKIIIAAVIALVMVIAGTGWYLTSQGWTPNTIVQSLNQTHPSEAHLKDDTGDNLPNRGAVGLPAEPAYGRGFERGAGHGATADPLAVRLLDDNGDGIPDRGVIDQASKGTFSRDFEPSHGRGFEPARGRPFGFLLVPFCFVGGLIGLGLVASPFIFFYRRRQSKLPAAPGEVQPTPDKVQPAPVEVPSTPDEVQPTTAEVQPAPVEVQPASAEVQPTPDEVQPTPDEARLEPPAPGESTEDSSNEEAMDNTP